MPATPTANPIPRRHRFSGHVFRGRYRTERVEDETYLGTVTRHVHLNPVRAPGGAPRGLAVVELPRLCPSRASSGVERVAHDELLASWGGEFGGSDPAGTYRRYVTAGLTEPPASPWSEAHHGWVLGSPEFVVRPGETVRGDPPREPRRESRRIRDVELRKVCEVVCDVYRSEPSGLSRRGGRHEARAASAYLARRHTAATNMDPAEILGVSRPDCVPNLTRRFAGWLTTRDGIRERLSELEGRLRQSLAREKAANQV